MLRSGDCEDFAIAKYLSLRDLGWENDQLRVAVVRDMNLKVTHAVLIVYYGGKAWVLDNQTNRVIETDQVRHYRPIFSINENYWWHHRPERPSFSEIATAWFAWGASPAASEPEENKTPLP
jgi:predicted transglutaminase-like cysteine proteinase